MNQLTLFDISKYHSDLDNLQFASKLSRLNSKELKTLVISLINVQNVKELKQWIKQNWKVILPYLNQIKSFAKDGLPNLKLAQTWVNLGIIINKILKHQDLKAKIKRWNKMTQLELRIEFLTVIKLPCCGTKSYLINYLTSHYTDYSEVI
ncbi:hypothetical protein [Gloeothece verrucosa]|uniref:Uncharacterized protein n=1 Tax=Gloeothece verrucosa (strain PCC 7822) TaxID=497965 RepID=E0UAH0_GLOV7|nr:hypothetical protein [Gloeothece verrucosa]ADN12711.1 hypothetical protein Cyan7822_0675 [Gloeothece verrucosa PCC 7822]